MSLRLLTRYGLPRDITSAAPSFSPSDIAGLRLWLDASDSTTIEATGGAVSKWTSKDANSREFVQTSGSLQPTTGSQTINSKNVISFSNDILRVTSSKSVWRFLHDGTKYNIFIVASIGDGTGNVAWWIMGNAQGSVNNVGIGLAWDDRSNNDRSEGMRIFIASGSSQTGVVSNNPANGILAADDQTANVYRYQADPSNDTVLERTTVYRNSEDGVQETIITTYGVPATVDATYDLELGSAGNQAGNSNIRIAEVLIYERDMSSSEVDDVTEYLAAKWGITL